MNLTDQKFAPVKKRKGLMRFLIMLPRLLLFPFLLIVGYIGFINHWGGDHWLVQTVWVLFLSHCAFCVGGSFHESIHLTLMEQPWANKLYGRLVGIFIGIPYSVYQETHRRHHSCLNTAKDYELWPYSDPDCSISFRRLFVWLDIFAGIFTAPLIYGRVFFDPQSDLKPDKRINIRREYVAVIAFWGFVIGGFIWAIQSGQIEGKQLRVVWLLPLILAPMFNTVRKLTEHLGMKSTDPIQGTRTVVGNNIITRASSYFNFELPIHGPHHRYPKVHGADLEAKLNEMQLASPERQIPLFPTYLAAVLDMLPHMLKNPRVGPE